MSGCRMKSDKKKIPQTSEEMFALAQEFRRKGKIVDALYWEDFGRKMAAYEVKL